MTVDVPPNARRVVGELGEAGERRERRPGALLVVAHQVRGAAGGGRRGAVEAIGQDAAVGRPLADLRHDGVVEAVGQVEQAEGVGEQVADAVAELSGTGWWSRDPRRRPARP